MDYIKEKIKDFMFFKDLSDIELMPFLRVIKKKKLEDKSLIFNYGMPITHVYFVGSGKVKVYRNDFAGKEQIMCLKQHGDMFPQVGFFREGNYPANAKAIGDTELFFISIKEFEEILVSNPYLSIVLCSVMGDRIVDVQQVLEEVKLRSAHDRFLLLLLRLCDSHGSIDSEGWIKLNSKFTNSDFANMIGTTRESVNRVISRLKKDGAMKLLGGVYYICPEKVKTELSI